VREQYLKLSEIEKESKKPDGDFIKVMEDTIDTEFHQNDHQI